MSTILPSEKLSLDHFLAYYPNNLSFESLTQMVRRGSVSIKVKPEYTKLQGSLADMMTKLERDVAEVVVMCDGLNAPKQKAATQKSPGLS